MLPTSPILYDQLTDEQIDQLESDLLLQVSRLIATLRATRALYESSRQHHTYNHTQCLESL